jgi:hypothetical protein
MVTSDWTAISNALAAPDVAVSAMSSPLPNHGFHTMVISMSLHLPCKGPCLPKPLANHFQLLSMHNPEKRRDSLFRKSS